ncbi:hypothetical protein C4J81_10870 [Deltaproteobacteria bacterium Smac51]|nr:hypothetical protein C4J81_10870 [Deltaproteobacteria bacterium Smac51]
MAIRKKVLIPLIVALLLVLIPLGAYYAGNISIKPDPARSALTPRYMGQAAIALPAGFELQSGRLAITCEGSPGLTAVMETPHQDYGPVAFEALSIMLPVGPGQIMKDLSLDFGRPAQLVHTRSGPDQVIASVIADLGPGSLRLSRTVKADPDTGVFSTDDFAREALGFLNNYAWGHRGSKARDLHSVYGHVGRAAPCSQADVNLLYSSSQNSARIFLTTANDLQSAARSRSLELATGGTLQNQPSWLSEAKEIFKGQWNRKVQGGPRKVAGRLGLEWVTVRRDMSSGRRLFVAQWQPEAASGPGPLPSIIMNADFNDAPAALRLWGDILNSSTLAMDFYL